MYFIWRSLELILQLFVQLSSHETVLIPDRLGKLSLCSIKYQHRPKYKNSIGSNA